MPQHPKEDKHVQPIIQILNTNLLRQCLHYNAASHMAYKVQSSSYVGTSIFLGYLRIVKHLRIGYAGLVSRSAPDGRSAIHDPKIRPISALIRSLSRSPSRVAATLPNNNERIHYFVH